MKREELARRKERARRAGRVATAMLVASLIASVLGAILFYRWHEALEIRLQGKAEAIKGKEQ